VAETQQHNNKLISLVEAYKEFKRKHRGTTKIYTNKGRNVTYVHQYYHYLTKMNNGVSPLNDGIKPELAKTPTIPYKMFNELIKDYTMSNIEVVLNGGVFVLPANLGRIYINSIPATVRKGINWQETRRQGKVVRFDNGGPDGKSYRFVWSRRFDTVHHRTRFYKLVINANIRKRLYNIIVNRERDYIDFYLLK
jgi:hypothetical protein